ncbi:MAG: UDP-N-acetylmuramate dehydrogenase [Gammaproteobacteria bacterium]|nr:UDP-N-acetylmuramate dehydrogenase [Gammaproteobacteria bacterium]
MLVEEHVSLKPYNTLRVESRCRYFVQLQSLADVSEFIAEVRFSRMPRLILGGGSNVLLFGNFDGVVARVALRGMETVRTDEAAVFLRAAAGEDWHGFVMHSIDQGHAGLENLSLIPGTVGGAPIQNIGAYGVELSDVLNSVDTLHAATGEARTFDRQECQFHYRDSVFKRDASTQYIITAVTVRLPHTPRYITGYRGVQQKLRDNGVSEPDARSISEAVCQLRRAKLPDPGTLGNAGSFFKNPLLPAARLAALREQYAQLPAHRQASGDYKIPAAWLLERCGWKGRRRGDAGFSDRHALVLVNHGHASGEELYDLAQQARQDVEARFGIELDIEPQIVRPTSHTHD